MQSYIPTTYTRPNRRNVDSSWFWVEGMLISLIHSTPSQELQTKEWLLEKPPSHLVNSGNDLQIIIISHLKTSPKRSVAYAKRPASAVFGTVYQLIPWVHIFLWHRFLISLSQSVTVKSIGSTRRKKFIGCSSITAGEGRGGRVTGNHPLLPLCLPPPFQLPLHPT